LDAGPDLGIYLWSTGAYTQMDTLYATTTAWVQVIDSAGCVTVSDTVEYAFNPIPARPIIQVLTESLHSSFANGYEWLLDGQLIVGQTSQDLPAPLPGLYEVIISNAFGCKATSDTVRVLAETAGDFVSGGFSPNGDGINDVFFVEGISRYPAIHLQVFNRWGDEVFAAKPYQNDWTGVGKNGHALPVGDYYYILDFGDGRETVQGNILISR
jgi:gliding motility-associated-like protein